METKGTNHIRFLFVGSFSETQCEIANGLRDRFNLDGFVVGKVVVLQEYSVNLNSRKRCKLKMRGRWTGNEMEWG